MTRVAAPAGKVQPDAHRSPWRRFRPGGQQGQLASLIDEIVREGARRMLAQALQAEVDAYIAASPPSGTERPPPGGPQRLHQPREVLTSAGAVEVTAPGSTKAHRPGHRRAAAVLLGDLAAVGAEDPEDHRGAAAALPARPVQRRLRARAWPVPGLAAGLSRR